VMNWLNTVFYFDSVKLDRFFNLQIKLRHWDRGFHIHFNKYIKTMFLTLVVLS
jgi:hypothetical protein